MAEMYGSYSDEDLNEWERLPQNIRLLTSSAFGAWLLRRDKRIKEQEPKTDKALNLLAEWAIECGFGYDNIPDLYEIYKDDIADMGYAEGLAYIAQMESEVEE